MYRRAKKTLPGTDQYLARYPARAHYPSLNSGSSLAGVAHSTNSAISDDYRLLEEIREHRVHAQGRKLVGTSVGRSKPVSRANFLLPFPRQRLLLVSGLPADSHLLITGDGRGG